MIEVLISLLQDPNSAPNHRIAAAEQLLLRGWGKPVLPIALRGELDVTEHILVDVSDEELERKLEDGG